MLSFIGLFLKLGSVKNGPYAIKRNTNPQTIFFRHLRTKNNQETFAVIISFFTNKNSLYENDLLIKRKLRAQLELYA
jgi:hypothetical protein